MATNLLYPEKIDRDSTKSAKFNAIKASMGDGYEQVAARGLNAKKELWKIKWVNLSLSEKTALEASLDSVGLWEILLWTPCYDTIEKQFRMAEAGYTVKRVSGNSVFTITCELLQVFDIV